MTSAPLPPTPVGEITERESRVRKAFFRSLLGGTKWSRTNVREIGSYKGLTRTDFCMTRQLALMPFTQAACDTEMAWRQM